MFALCNSGWRYASCALNHCVFNEDGPYVPVRWSNDHA